MNYRFADLVDLQTLAELLSSLHKATGLPVIVLDHAGMALASAGWRTGCSIRHAEDPCMSLICRMGAVVLGLDPGPCAASYQLFKCPYGLCDAAVPILVEGETVASLHIGQFLLSPPDMAWHKARARRLHLDETSYLDMIRSAPVVALERLEKTMAFHARLADTLADQGLKRLRLRAAESALARSENRYRRLLSSVTNYIYTVRVDAGRIVSVRHGLGCEPVSGYPPRAFEADPLLWARLVHEEDRQMVVRFFESIMNSAPGEDVAPLEHRIRRKDGQLRWIRNTPVVTRGSGNQVTLFEGLVQDITERKNMEEELKAASLKAEQASRAKSDFLATMSHEIRTPMNAILGLTRLALKRVSDRDVRDFLEGVSDAGASLLTILNDILDFSKIEAGRLDIEEEDFDPLDVLSQAARTLGIQAARKGLDLSVETSGAIPPLIRGDSHRMRQVLINLLGNAVKFTARGQVTLRASLTRDEALQTDVFHVSVQDTGIGIPADKLEVIFDTFTQADSTTTRRYGGTGLGLAISRKLVAMMGGRIWVESEVGRGSTFHFSLPLKVAGAQAHPAPARPRLRRRITPEAAWEETGPRPLRILLAEDEPANQVFAKTFLEEEGHEVEVAENGARALEKLSQGGFDVVLMDVSMPVMDGVTATRLIRAGQAPGANPDLPIIALTAHAIKGDQERFLEAGMDACVVKPVDIDELSALLEEVRRGRQPAQRIQPQTAHAQEFDQGWLRKWFDGREGMLATLLAIFKDETPRRLQKIREALADAAGVPAAQVMEEAQREAHSLKGSAAVVGATTIRTQAAKLEEALTNGHLELAAQCLNTLESDWLATQAELEAGAPQRSLTRSESVESA